MKPGALSSAGAWWRERSLRERRALQLALLLVGALLLWWAVRPAWQTLRAAPAQLAQLDVQWQAMQRQAAEARELRATPPVTVEQAQLALKASADALGDKARLVVQGDRATLTLNGLPSGALRDWLLQARSSARARPIEARLTRAASGYSGSIVLVIGGGA